MQKLWLFAIFVGGCFAPSHVPLPELPEGTRSTVLIGADQIRAEDLASASFGAVPEGGPLSLLAYGCPIATLGVGVGDTIGPPPPTTAKWAYTGDEWRAIGTEETLADIRQTPCTSPTLIHEQRGALLDPDVEADGVLGALWAKPEGEEVAVITVASMGQLFLRSPQDPIERPFDQVSTGSYLARTGDFDRVLGVMRVLATDGFAWKLLTFSQDARTYEETPTSLSGTIRDAHLSWGTVGEEAYSVDNFGGVHHFRDGTWLTISTTSTLPRDGYSIAWQAPGRGWVTGSCAHPDSDNGCGMEVAQLDGDRLLPAQRISDDDDRTSLVAASPSGGIYVATHGGRLYERPSAAPQWRPVDIPTGWIDAAAAAATDDGVIIGWSDFGVSTHRDDHQAPRCAAQALGPGEVRGLLVRDDKVALVTLPPRSRSVVIRWGTVAPHCGL